MFKSLKDGFFSPLRGGRFLIKNPRLIRFALIPFIINVLIYACFVILAYKFLPGILGEMLREPQEWWEYILYYVKTGLIIASIILIIVFTFSIVGSIIASPFNERLAIKILKTKNADLDIPETKGLKAFYADAKRIIFVETKKGVLLSIIVLISMIINFIPIPGLGIISFVITSILIGYNFIDYPLEIMKYKLRDRIKFTLKNFWFLFAFGMSIGVILAVPFINLLLIPIAVSGSALRFSETEGSKDS